MLKAQAVYPHHVVLVSDQPIPTITPLIDPALGARRVTLVASPFRRDEAGWQRSVIDGRGLQTRLHVVEDPYDLQALEAFFDRLLQDLDPAETALNLTGGSKPMSIAAHDRFRAAGCGIYYVRIDRDTVAWLHPRGLPEHPIADRIRIEECLAACGVQIEESARTGRWPEAWLRFAAQLFGDDWMRASITGMRAHQGTLKLRADTLPPAQVLSHLRKLGMIRNGPDEVPCYSSTRAQRFLGGGWLEILVYRLIGEIARQDPLMHGDAINLKVSRGEEGISSVKNEFDIVFLRDNTLHLVECKTGKKTDPAVIKPVLFGLAELRRRIGGLRGRVALVSVYALGKGMQELARALGVHVIDGVASMRVLASELDAWIRSGKGG